MTWSHLQVAKQPSIGKLIDEAIPAIEVANPGLKGVLPKDYNRALDKVMLGEPIDLVCGSASLQQKPIALCVPARGFEPS
jgi:type I restriction enzyme M protein